MINKDNATFQIEFRKGALNKKIGVITLDDEAQEIVGDVPCCQNCEETIKTPFFVCESQRWRWFCNECQKGDFPLCKFEIKEDEHKHFCIKIIEGLGEDS